MIHNLTLGTLPELTGTFINYNFVHMDKQDMGKFDNLLKVQIAGNVLAFGAVMIIPTQKKLNQYIQEFKNENLK